MSHFEIDISSLKPGASAVVIAVLRRARLNRGKRNHKIPLADFFREAGLGDEIRIGDFLLHVAEAITVPVRRSNNSAEVLDSRPFFDRARVSKSSFHFAINKFALDASLFPLPLSIIREKLAERGRPSIWD